jgi:hypothetical protein
MGRADGFTGDLNSCGCGCGTMVHSTVASQPCGCGCGADEHPRSAEQEIAELTALRESIDRRLNDLAT